MKFLNNSKHIVYLTVFSGWPCGPTNLVETIENVIQGGSTACTLDPGDYYAHISNGGFGPIPARAGQILTN